MKTIWSGDVNCRTKRSSPLKTIRFGILLFAVGFLNGCGNPTQSPPERFVAAYKRAFNSADTNAVLALINWDDVPEEIRLGTTWLHTHNMGEHKITKTILTPFESNPILPPWHRDNRKLVSNLQPKYWLEVSTETRQGVTNSPSKTVKQLLLGVEGENILFCGFKFAEP